MIIGILTLITALSISAVAIYYSVAGLVAIFAAAAIPIMVMGGVLEVGKLVTAVWLHRYWDRATWWLRSYLSVAVLVLMFITSMGIFGFLSKAHIEQTSMSTEQVALIDTLNDKETRSQAKIDRWRDELSRLLKGEDVRVDNLIEREQSALKDLYAQIDKEKTAARSDADKQIALQNDRLKQAQERKEADIKAAQDRYAGSFSKDGLDKAIETAKKNELSVASSAQREIRNINSNLNDILETIDKKYADDINAINSRIQKLRNQANSKTTDIDSRVEELEGFIDVEQKKIDEVREEKLVYEKEYRLLEAEVGPIKYIAEFIYGENADTDLLEEAVRWVIIIIIFVFDPLAVLLLIASQYTFNWRKEDVLNLPPEDKSDENDNREDPQGPTEGDETPPPQQPDEGTEVAPEVVDAVEPEEQSDVIRNTDEEVIEEIEKKAEQEKDSLEAWNEWVEAANTAAEQDDDADDDIDELEVSIQEKAAMKRWKAENPENTIKWQRSLYQRRKISELPWLKYMTPEDDFPVEDEDALEAARWAQEQIENKQKETVSWMEKEGAEQIKKTKELEGYVQNSEQASEGTLWNKIKQAKDDK